MTDLAFPDEWLAGSLEGVLSPEQLTEVRSTAEAGRTLWETVVGAGLTSDEQILGLLSDRFRLKLADLSMADPGIRGTVPEQVARNNFV